MSLLDRFANKLVRSFEKAQEERDQAAAYAEYYYGGNSGADLPPAIGFETAVQREEIAKVLTRRGVYNDDVTCFL